MSHFDIESTIIADIAAMLSGNGQNTYAIFERYNLTNEHKKVKDYLISTKRLTKAEWNGFVRRREMETKWGGNPRNALEFFELFVERTVRSWLPHRILVHGQDMPIDEAQLLTRCRAAVIEEELPFTDRQLDTAISMRKQRMEATEYETFRSAVAHDPQALSEDERLALWATIQRCVFPSHDVEFVRRIIETFLWQVKRKMSGLPIPQPMMTVFEGPQNQGKSHFIEKHLLRCVPPMFFGKANFTQLLDSRNHDIKRKYVIWLDEMEHAEKADITTLKSFMTSLYEESRTMYTNSGATVANNTTLIGCMNGTLSQAIRDSTGYRRFVSLVFMKNKAMDLNEIHRLLDEVDWLALWKSVDETSDTQPSERVREAIQAQQSDNTDESSVSLYIKEILGDGSSLAGLFADKGRVGSLTLFQDYMEWAEQRHRSKAGIPHATARSFGKEVSRLIDHQEIDGLRKDKGRGENGYRLVIDGQNVDVATFAFSKGGDGGGKVVDFAPRHRTRCT